MQGSRGQIMASACRQKLIDFLSCSLSGDVRAAAEGKGLGGLSSLELSDKKVYEP